MSSQATDVRSYSFSSSDRLLLDANVWLYCYVPTRPGGHWERTYSRALSSVLNAKAVILLDSLVLAEFANRSAYIKYDLAVDEDPEMPDTFRKFCGSEYFEDVARAVSDEVRYVLKNSQPVDVPFGQFDTAQLVVEFESGKRGFNDLLIAELCRKLALTLVTNDAGFAGLGVPLLTGNPRLLS